ncbi:MAG: RNA-directed DNA polymerase [Pseudanabaena sp.]|nr:RNA-directed DNA polymerase [Pseudanabaena sp. 42896M_M3]
MAENDVAAIAFRYKYLIKTDIKNFYPSIYTHSIPWALHDKAVIRQPNKRNDYEFIGNRLDKLFQNANDGCTNGIPIGPVV